MYLLNLLSEENDGTYIYGTSLILVCDEGFISVRNNGSIKRVSSTGIISSTSENTRELSKASYLDFEMPQKYFDLKNTEKSSFFSVILEKFGITQGELLGSTDNLSTFNLAPNLVNRQGARKRLGIQPLYKSPNGKACVLYKKVFYEINANGDFFPTIGLDFSPLGCKPYEDSDIAPMFKKTVFLPEGTTIFPNGYSLSSQASFELADIGIETTTASSYSCIKKKSNSKNKYNINDKLLILPDKLIIFSTLCYKNGNNGNIDTLDNGHFQWVIPSELGKSTSIREAVENKIITVLFCREKLTEEYSYFGKIDLENIIFDEVERFNRSRGDYIAIFKVPNNIRPPTKNLLPYLPQEKYLRDMAVSFGSSDAAAILLNSDKFSKQQKTSLLDIRRRQFDHLIDLSEKDVKYSAEKMMLCSDDLLTLPIKFFTKVYTSLGDYEKLEQLDRSFTIRDVLDDLKSNTLRDEFSCRNFKQLIVANLSLYNMYITKYSEPQLQPTALDYIFDLNITDDGIKKKLLNANTKKPIHNIANELFTNPDLNLALKRLTFDTTSFIQSLSKHSQKNFFTSIERQLQGLPRKLALSGISALDLQNEAYPKIIKQLHISILRSGQDLPKDFANKIKKLEKLGFSNVRDCILFLPAYHNIFNVNFGSDS